MTLLIVIIGLLTVTTVGLILSLRKFEILKAKYGDVIAYIPASLAAIFLALLSSYLPFHLSEVAELDDAKQLLANGQHDIYQTRQGLIGFYYLMRKDSVEEYSFAGTLSRNDVPTPRIFLRLLGNETVLKSMNEEMIESARMFESNMLEIIKWLAVDSLSNAKVSMLINAYGAELWKIEEILKIYIECLVQGESDSTFSAEKQVILKKYLYDPEIKANRKQHPWLELGP